MRCNSRLREKIETLRSLGLKIVYEKWFESDDEWFCYWMEAYLIDYFGRDNLCNLTRGGESPPSGPDLWTYGIPRPEETIAKIKENVPKGEEHYLFGVKGEEHPAFGYKHTPEEIDGH